MSAGRLPWRDGKYSIVLTQSEEKCPSPGKHNLQRHATRAEETGIELDVDAAVAGPLHVEIEPPSRGIGDFRSERGSLAAEGRARSQDRRLPAPNRGPASRALRKSGTLRGTRQKWNTSRLPCRCPFLGQVIIPDGWMVVFSLEDGEKDISRLGRFAPAAIHSRRPSLHDRPLAEVPLGAVRACRPVPKRAIEWSGVSTLS